MPKMILPALVLFSTLFASASLAESPSVYAGSTGDLSAIERARTAFIRSIPYSIPGPAQEPPAKIVEPSSCSDWATVLACGVSTTSYLSSSDCFLTEVNTYAEFHLLNVTPGTTFTVKVTSSTSYTMFVAIQDYDSGTVYKSAYASGSVSMTYTAVQSQYIIGFSTLDSFAQLNYDISISCSGSTSGSCTPDYRTACLLGRRFKATVRYRGVFDNSPADTDASLKTVTGFADPSYETAFFYFNSASNIELLLKLLDQGNTDSSGRKTIAVLFGTATPLRIELTITDTVTSTVKRYTSDFGAMSGKTDFTAFVK